MVLHDDIQTARSLGISGHEKNTSMDGVYSSLWDRGGLSTQQDDRHRTGSVVRQVRCDRHERHCRRARRAELRQRLAAGSSARKTAHSRWDCRTLRSRACSSSLNCPIRLPMAAPSRYIRPPMGCGFRTCRTVIIRSRPTRVPKCRSETNGRLSSITKVLRSCAQARPSARSIEPASI
jgi:hypothetical protein